MAVCPFFLYSANVVTQSEVSSVADVLEAVSPPVASPSYAAAASRSPEQTEAIKAARAAGLGSTQSSENLPSSHQLSLSSSKQLSGDSTKQAPTQSLKKAASEPPPSVLPVKDRVPAPEKHAEREREHSRERDRDRDRERASARDRDRDRDRPRDRDYSREGERDRSGRRRHHHRHDSRSSEEDSDYGFVELRPKHCFRR